MLNWTKKGNRKVIKFWKFQHPILHNVYDIVAETEEQEKQIMLCKVSIHIGIARKEILDKAAKEVTTKVLEYHTQTTIQVFKEQEMLER